MKKRHPFLLLEMIIALAIMAGVMGLLFTGFYGVIKAKERVEKERERVLSLQRLKLRFSLLFKDVIEVSALSEREYRIKHRGGIDPDPRFRTEIETILKLQGKVLTLSSLPEEGAPRQETLGEQIETIRFEFFDEKEGTFTPHYPRRKPFMMKVILNQKELPLFL
jgi:hypothetical protein